MGEAMQQSRGQGPGRGQGIRVHGAAETPPINRTMPRQAPQQAGYAGPNGTEPQPSRPPRQDHAMNMAPVSFARIKVVGVGGAGGNAINRMVMGGVDGIEFVS